MIGADRLSDLVNGAGLGSAAVVVLPLLPHGPPVGVNEDLTIYPASMVKTPLAVAVAVAERAGRLSWTDSVEIDPANMTLNDAPSALIAGATATIRELVDRMVSRSDNVATNQLIDLVDRARATDDLRHLGFPGTAIRRKLSGALPLIADPQASGRNTHPPREGAELFARLAAGDVPGSPIVCAALADQYWNAKLSMGLAADDRFAHKTGDTDEVSHDGGILTLESGERYAIVVYTTLPSDPITDSLFGGFMRALRPYLTDRSG